MKWWKIKSSFLLMWEQPKTALKPPKRLPRAFRDWHCAEFLRYKRTATMRVTVKAHSQQEAKELVRKYWRFPGGFTRVKETI